MSTPPWLEVHQGSAPLLLSMPHTGTDMPGDLLPHYASLWLARKDTDWWIERLYDFAIGLGATTIRTRLSRSVIDVNRDPSGQSLYPGHVTTGLCPLTTFDGEALYHPHYVLEDAEIERRRALYFDAYHTRLQAEIERLRHVHAAVVVYDCHSIRSKVARLFSGELPHFNIGSNDGKSCHANLIRSMEALCAASRFRHVTNGRFKGGYITRHYGNPYSGVHAVQMELACRGYTDEPECALTPDNWPSVYTDDRAAAVKNILQSIIKHCLLFAHSQGQNHDA